MSTTSKSYEDQVEIVNEREDEKTKAYVSPRYKGKNPKTPEQLKAEREARRQKNDAVNHPSHYMIGKYEAIDIIEEATKELTGIFATDTGNALKYIFRWNKKKNPKEDLHKAIWYLNHIIKKLDEVEAQKQEGV